MSKKLGQLLEKMEYELVQGSLDTAGTQARTRLFCSNGQAQPLTATP